MIKSKLAGVIAATGMMMLSAVCQTARADAMEDIVKRGEMIVGVQNQGTPINFVDAKGERTGFAVEFVNMMAQDMGVKVTYVDFEWKGLIPALLSGKVDFIAADMTPTPERAMKLIFTDPIFYTENVAFTLKDKSYQKWQDLNAAGIAVGATQASTYSAVVKSQMPLADLKEFSGGSNETAQALMSGRVDAGVSDRGTLRTTVTEFPDIRILDGTITKEPLAFAMRPDSVHLAFFLNNYIKLATHDDRLPALLDYWWNSVDWQADHK